MDTADKILHQTIRKLTTKLREAEAESDGLRARNHELHRELEDSLRIATTPSSAKRHDLYELFLPPKETPLTKAVSELRDRAEKAESVFRLTSGLEKLEGKAEA